MGGGLFHELRSSQVRGTDPRPARKLSGLISLLISISFYTRFQVMRSRCQDECEADVKISSLEFVQSVQDNAKPMSCRMQSRCQDNAKPMSKRIWEFCRVKVGWVSRVVGVNAKPMSRMCAADVKIMRSRCRDESEVDINTTAKPMSRRQSQAVSCMYRRARMMEVHTNALTADGNKQTDMFLPIFALIARLLSSSSS